MSSKASKKQEKRIAGEIGGRTVVASGAFDFQKNDCYNDVFLTECKYTEAKSFSIKLEYWNTVVKEAFSRGRLPSMVVEFLPSKEQVVVLRYNEWLDYQRLLLEEKDGGMV